MFNWCERIYIKVLIIQAAESLVAKYSWSTLSRCKNTRVIEINALLWNTLRGGNQKDITTIIPRTIISTSSFPNYSAHHRCERKTHYMHSERTRTMCRLLSTILLAASREYLSSFLPVSTPLKCVRKFGSVKILMSGFRINL